MNRSHLPLPSLRAFEATGRLLSVSKAAVELCVTPGAISQQVKLLEQRVGVELLRKNGRSIELSDAGQVLLPHLTQAFDRIGYTLDAITARPQTQSQALKVCLLPALAERWLMPRLARFHGAHPDLDILVMTSFREIDFDTDGFDMASYVGHDYPPGMTGVRLFDDEFLPVCSKQLLADQGSLKLAQDLQHCTLLHSVRRMDDWHQWLSAAGLPDLRPPHNLTFGNASLAIQAALDGIGIAIAQRQYVKQHLDVGTLVAPFDLVARSENGYYLIWPLARAISGPFALFKKWLLSEASGNFTL